MIALNQLSAGSSAASAPSLETRPVAETVADATPEAAALIALLQRAQAGDLVAQSELVRRYARRIAGFLRTIVRPPDAVDDVTQMVFIKTIRRLPHLRNAAVFESWLFKLARNTALDFLRRQRRRPNTVALDAAPDVSFLAPEHSVHEIGEALDHALARLGAIDRALVTQFVRGESYRAIATRAGLTLGAVKARLHRVRPFLRAAINAEINPAAPTPAQPIPVREPATLRVLAGASGNAFRTAPRLAA